MVITVQRETSQEIHLYTYTTKHLSPTKKVQFFYALNGRNHKPGLIDGLSLEHIGIAVLLVPKEAVKQLEDFFSSFNIHYTKKILYKEVPK